MFGDPAHEFAQIISRAAYLVDDGEPGAGVLRGMDEDLGGRLALAALAVYTAYGMSYYSHEAAHDHILRKHGLGERFSLDFGSWSSGWPDYDMIDMTTSSYAALLGDRAIFQRYLAGLNQEGINGRLTWASSAGSGEIDLQSAASFLVQKLGDLSYIAYTGLTDRRPSAPPPTFEDAADYITANGLSGLCLHCRKLSTAAQLRASHSK